MTAADLSSGKLGAVIVYSTLEHRGKERLVQENFFLRRSSPPLVYSEACYV